MIICSKCGKENQARYKFCLGCGTQLNAADALAAPPAASAKPAAPRRPTGRPSPTPPAGLPKLQTAPPAQLAPTEPERDSQPDAASAAPPGMEPCKSCGTPNPTEFVFCGNCGARLQEIGQRTSGLAEARHATSQREEQAPVGKLALIRPDGSEGGNHPLHAPETLVGRGVGPLFDNDSYLSPQHARLTFSDGKMLVEDAGSLNGVFVRITQEERLNPGDIFRIGQELLRFDVVKEPRALDDGTESMGSPNPGYWGRISIIVGPGIDGSAFPLMGDEIVLGRERGDILFSDDGYVSGTHAKVAVRADGCYLTDLGSSNGTFIKRNSARPVSSGTFILMGQQLFRADYRYR